MIFKPEYFVTSWVIYRYCKWVHWGSLKNVQGHMA